MHYSTAIATLFAASMAPITLASLSAEAIEEAVGDGCRNHIEFKGRFRTEDGSPCGSCALCEGSTVNALFVPQAKDTCIQCTKAEDTCSVFEVIASFENAWAMKYATLTSSALAPTSDPNKVTTLGSNDLVTWEVLHSQELKFSDREQKAEFSISNEKKYKHYSVQFQRSDDVMSIGKYGLVEAYTRGCTSELHAGIAGELVPVYSTSSPTNAPTNPGYQFNTKSELQTAVDLWVSDEAAALKDYGNIEGWNVGGVKDMSWLFYNKKTFKEDLSLWDTSAVSNMQRMFQYTTIFNSNLSDWNVSAVTNMRLMFNIATKFNSNLSNWNVSATTDMSFMFTDAKEFDQALCWDTSTAETVQIFTRAKGGSVDPDDPKC